METLSLFSFNYKSFFLYDLREKKFNSLTITIKDKNNFKPNYSEIEFLDNIIKDNLKNKLDLEEESDNRISILPQFKQSLIEFIPGIHRIKGKTKIINDIVNGFKKKENMNLKKICRKYESKTGNSISKSYVSYVLKNKLNYRYLKTVAKTNKLNTKSSRERCFFFIKVIINALKLKLGIIYIDESNFQLDNNHLKIWRKKNEIPCFNIGKRGRKNIILAISNEELLLYKINNGTNNSNTFLDFMKNLVNVLDEKGIKESLIIMDNCSIHMTKTLKEFYNNNK